MRIDPGEQCETRNIWKDLSCLIASGKMNAGAQYLLSCWVKAGKKASDIGGIYWGAGVALGIWNSTWKESIQSNAKTGSTGEKWVKIAGAPFECPKWAKASQLSAGLSYTAGEAWIDEIELTEAFTPISMRIRGSELLQVIMDDEKGLTFFNSGKLPKGTKEFSKDLRIQSSGRYTIKALDKNGRIAIKTIP
ncbi:MAG: hypothetical protein PHV34_21130 [Verrucomicrobiae bacterium]|nr:hypothetical protein [Verrucomicrobiae bacterium]